MTCRFCENLRFVPCPRASVKTVCPLSCPVCHGKHMIPCPDCAEQHKWEPLENMPQLMVCSVCRLRADGDTSMTCAEVLGRTR